MKEREERRMMPNDFGWSNSVSEDVCNLLRWEGTGTEGTILFWTCEFSIHIRSPSKNVQQAVTYEDTGLEVKEVVRARDTHLGNICIKIFRATGLDEIIRGECTAKEDIEYTFFIKTKVSVHSKREMVEC